MILQQKMELQKKIKLLLKEIWVLKLQKIENYAKWPWLPQSVRVIKKTSKYLVKVIGNTLKIAL